MEMEIVLPRIMPVMTLPEVAFFPQSLLPLHIFEPRYRQMLKDVLASNRLFAVAGLNARLQSNTDLFEPAHRIASVGLVRACQKNDNGTSNLLLQGLCRVELLEVVADEPYRQVRLRAVASAPGATPAENQRLRTELSKLIRLKRKLGVAVPSELTEFLETVEDPETFVDIAAFNLCESPVLKQRLLETLDVHARLQLLSRRLRFDVESIKLQRRLQGPLSDSRIADN